MYAIMHEFFQGRNYSQYLDQLNGVFCCHDHLIAKLEKMKEDKKVRWSKQYNNNSTQIAAIVLPLSTTHTTIMGWATYIQS